MIEGEKSELREGSLIDTTIFGGSETWERERDEVYDAAVGVYTLRDGGSYFSTVRYFIQRSDGLDFVFLISAIDYFKGFD